MAYAITFEQTCKPCLAFLFPMHSAYIDISDNFHPIATCKDYGPYRRWLKCYENALASSCPIVTREVSDSIPYSTVKDPFKEEKPTKDYIPENTQFGQSFNVCTGEDPIGSGNKKIEGFLRWQFEEPNHLARLPAWFESAGGGYGHEDFVFQTQVRDYDYPFMELAVPFPIDLITRDCRGLNQDGTCNNDDQAKYGAGESNIDDLNDGREVNIYGTYTNNLGEVKQREGLGYSQMIYSNPQGMMNEFDTDGRFRSRLLKTADVRQIEPVIISEACIGKGDCDSKEYNKLYRKYVEGLYAAAASFSHKEAAEAPGHPALDAESEINNIGKEVPFTENQNIHPRAQDMIVGPRGCDIGGWYEMMLYQARCIRWHKLNCICDYDKTFAVGNSINFALREVGAKLPTAIPSFKGKGIDLIMAQDEKGEVYTVQRETKRDMSGREVDNIEIVGEDMQTTTSVKRSAEIIPMAFNRDSSGQIIIPSNITAKDAEPFINYQDNFMPLADRGLVGPEFAPLSNDPSWKTGEVGTQGVDFKLTGLDDVLVGDIIIWDETIQYQGIDVGYPRHAAVVVKVNRGDLTDISNGSLVKRKPRSIVVREMNWGKHMDSCGNTDRWGLMTERTIHKPICSSYSIGNAAEPCEYGEFFPPASDGTRIPGTIDKYASCQNSDWASCVEKYWDQVKIYRSYTSKTGQKIPVSNDDLKYDTGYYDPSSQTCKSIDEEFPSILNSEWLNENARDILSEGGLEVDSDEIEYKGFTSLSGKIDRASTKAYLQSKYEDGEVSLQKVIRDSELWKLLVQKTNVYPFDEIQNLLFSPLDGVSGVCDPPLRKRKYFEKTLEDVRARCGDNDLPCIIN
jgi:hypothetical protein